MHPLARYAGLTLKGSVSLISRSPAAPYEISSLATPEGAARNLAPPPGWQRTRFEGAKRRTNRSESLSRRVSWRRRRLRGCISKCMYLYSYTAERVFVSSFSLEGRGTACGGGVPDGIDASAAAPHPSCGFAAALLQGPACLGIEEHGVLR